MKRIALTQGQEALVDDEDYKELSQFKWFAMYSKDIKSFYAMRSFRQDNGKRGKLGMHRQIMGAKHGEQVDHRDHQTLDNRRANLRLTTNQGNRMNQRLRSDNTSGFCGVRWHKAAKKWRASLEVDGEHVSLGLYANKADAIEARKAANILYGFHENHGKAI